MTKPMIGESFFTPRNVAVIGATNKLGFGHGIPKHLINNGYRDRLYLINPREKELFGLPVNASITDVPGEVDLAIIAIPAPSVPEAVKGCLKKGIHSIIIESAGFSEIGSEGARIEREVADMIETTKTRIIGPNCVGVINLHNGFASTEVSFDDLKSGNIGVVAQSGVFGNIMVDWAPSQNLRLSKVISIGNRLDVDEVDMLEYLLSDDQTEVIVLYLEGVKDGRRFIETASRVARKKPLLVLKSGCTEEGKAATASHTGSMAGNDAIYDAVFAQCGIIRANSFQELFDIAKVMSTQPTPPGPEVAVVTTSGSLGAMTTDSCAKLGLTLPPYSPETIEKIRAKAPGWMNVRNPLDLGPSGLFGEALTAALKEPNMKSVILIPIIPNSAFEVMASMDMDLSMWFGKIHEIRDIAPDKPIIATTMGKSLWVKRLREFFGEGIPIVSSTENAARALFELYRYGLGRH